LDWCLRLTHLTIHWNNWTLMYWDVWNYWTHRKRLLLCSVHTAWAVKTLVGNGLGLEREVTLWWSRVDLMRWHHIVRLMRLRVHHIIHRGIHNVRWMVLLLRILLLTVIWLYLMMCLSLHIWLKKFWFCLFWCRNLYSRW
jgi:hypothetical protein